MLHEKYNKLQLITPKMLYSTVICDERTCLWYSRLFSTPSVVRLMKDGAQRAQLFKDYMFFSRLMKLCLVLAVGFGVTAFLLPGFLRWFFVGGVLLSALLAVAFMFKVRRLLASLAVELLHCDGEGMAPGTTLFQLGEIYARKYGVMSLVDLIWYWDRFLRDVILFVFMLSFGVFFMPFWFTAVVLTLSCILSSYFIKLWYMLRKNA